MPDEPQLGYEDGLPFGREVGAWAETKYRLIGLYDALFSTGMKYKWGRRIYIDLYAGAGYSRVRNSTKILCGSPILALKIANPFDKYIFCEESEELLDALRRRVTREAPNANVAFILGDCNSEIDRICSEIPTASTGNTVLTKPLFCRSINLGIKFDTLQELSERLIDFLCLLALYMDANRNESQYVSEQSHRVSEFLGTENWRDAWRKAQSQLVPFPRFLAQQFAERMGTLDYIQPPFYAMKEVRSDEKNLPLYHLALFSRNQRAYDFWDEVLKYSTDQLGLF